MRECEYYHQCLNNTKCYRCSDEQLLKLPKHEKSKVKRKRYSNPDSSDKNSWEELEDRVAEQLNKVPTMKDARRARASGAKIKPLAPIVVIQCFRNNAIEIS